MTTILVVDDNVEIAELFRICLSLGGYQVSVAHNLKQAVATCKERTFDAILVDFTLSDGVGPSLVDLLGECMPKVRLLVSGYAPSGLQSRYPGFDAYLGKPVSCSELCGRIKGLLQTKGSVCHGNDSSGG